MTGSGKSEKKVERNIDKLLNSSERLENRISDLEAGLTSLMDQQFDANVYRKALEHTVQEHVFTKIQKAVLIVGALGSIGFVVMARGFIKDQVDDAWKYLTEGINCSMLLFNNNPIGVTPPNHVVLKVEYCEPGAKGNTATNVTKPVQVETGAEISCPSFVEMGELIKVDTRTGEYIERVKE